MNSRRLPVVPTAHSVPRYVTAMAPHYKSGPSPRRRRLASHTCAMRTSAAATGAALLLLAAVASAMDMPPEFMEIVNKCKAEHEPTEDELKGMMMLQVPESSNGKCFMGCVLQEIGVVKEGKFDKEEAKKHAASKMTDKDELEKHMQLIEKCSEEVNAETDSCGIGPKLMECIKQFAPEFDIALPQPASE